MQGALDPAAEPHARATPERIAAFVDEMLALGNADHTVAGRLQEVADALRILAPGRDFGWVRRPGGVSPHRQLEMTKRSFTVHHPRKLYRWGVRLMERALTLTGPRRRQVMLRDGLMIALLAARGLRRRSVAAMELGNQVRRDAAGRWWIVLDARDVKTGRPLEYPAPASLAPWIERYVAVERAELLAGRACDAFWVNRAGAPLGVAGIEKRIRWHSAKAFGPSEAFGPHRFRYGIATLGPMEDPDAPAVGAAVLGVTRGVAGAHYERGGQAAAAARFQHGLAEERRRTGALARRLFEARRGGGGAATDAADAGDTEAGVGGGAPAFGPSPPACPSGAGPRPPWRSGAARTRARPASEPS